MSKTTTHAASELASLIECHKVVEDGKLFSHLSRLPMGIKPSVYRRLRERGLIERHPENDLHDGATVWAMTAKGLDVRPGEELSAVM